MAEVSVRVAGRQYRLACADGEERALGAAAEQVDAVATALSGQLGAVPEARLLLMTALSVAGNAGPPAAPGLPALAARIEALADRLENAARSA